MYDSNVLQTSIEMWFAAFSLVAAACLIVGREEKTMSRTALTLLQFTNSIYMLGEGFAYFLSGGDNEIAFYGVRIANYAAYFGQFSMLLATTFYVRAIVSDGSEVKKKQRWHRLMIIAAFIAYGLLAYNTVSPVFFYITESNEYVRAKYYLVSQFIGAVMIVFPLIMLFLQRKHVSRTTFIAVYFFALSPLIAMVYQYFHYGFSITGFVTTASVLLMFVAYELDVSKKIEMQNKKKFEELVYKQ